MSKILIRTKNNSTTEIIIMIKEKNIFVIADTITILQRKNDFYSLLKFPNKTSINFQNMNFSPSSLYSQPGKLQMDRGTA